MNKPSQLERLLAGMLHYGTGLASAVIALGFALALIDARVGTHNLAILPNAHFVTLGIALFILLPAMRVLVMLIIFLRERDYRFGAIAALVLVIISLGFALGMHMASAMAK